MTYAITLGLCKHQLNEDIVGNFFAKEIQVSDGYLDQGPLRSFSNRTHLSDGSCHLTGSQIFLLELTFNPFVINKKISEVTDKSSPCSFFVMLNAKRPWI